MTIVEKLDAFIKKADEKGWPCNEWISDDKMQVYVRKAIRYLDESKVTVLDIANIIVEEKDQGSGLFTNLIREAERLNPWQGMFIENVLNPILEEWCIRHNWKLHPLYGPPPCYYKMKGK